jgi:cytochrome c553
MKLFASLLLAVALPLSLATQAQEGKSPAAAASAAVPAAAPAKADTKFKPDLAKAEKLYGEVCASCHGADGNSSVPANPKLAGQHPEFIAAQLDAFKSGKRNNAVMKGFASSLSESDMQSLGAWLGSKKPKTGFSKDKNLVQLGERIYRGGVADRQIPACASCHSPNGAGIPSQYPRLAGQHADYVASRLVHFRDTANANVSMSSVAAKMNDREIKAVADYVAGLR